MAMDNGRHLIALILCFFAVAQSGGQTAWTNAFPRNVDIAYGNNTFVMVGDVTRVSTNGRTWTQIQEDSSSLWRGVAFGNDRFVAIRQNGIGAISSDGFHWDNINLLHLIDPTTGFQGVRFIENAFYVLSQGILRSEDGKTWTRQVTNTHAIFSIAKGAGKFVAIGSQPLILVSSDGLSWESRNPMPSGASQVLFFKDRFLAMCGNQGIYESWDGLEWHRFAAQPQGLQVLFHDGSNLYSFRRAEGLLISSDAITWTPVNSGSSHPLARGIRGPDGLYICGTGNELIFSEDGGAWQSVSTSAPYNGTLFSVASGGGRDIVAGGDGVVVFRESGNPWQAAEPFGAATLRSAAFYEGKFYAVSSRVYVSEDGRNWAEEAGAPVKPFLRIASLGSNLVATATFGRVYFKNSQGWRESLVDTNLYLFGSAYGNGRYLVFGDKALIVDPPPGSTDPDLVPVIYSSTDLVNWTPGPTNMFAYYGGAFGNGRFVLAGAEGAVLWSENGLSWNAARAPTLAPLTDVIFAGGRFLAAGHNGAVLVSEDGVKWDLVSCATSDWLHALGSTGKSVIGLGANGGAIVESPLDVFFSKPVIGRGRNVFKLYAPGPVTVEKSSDLMNWEFYLDVNEAADPFVFQMQNGVNQFFRARLR